MTFFFSFCFILFYLLFFVSDLDSFFYFILFYCVQNVLFS